MPNPVINRRLSGATGAVAPSLLTELQAYWKLDEVSGSRADSSGNGNTLTDINNSITSATGKINLGAFSPGGGGGRVLSHADNASLGAGSGVSWSASIWALVNSGTYPGTLVSKSDIFFGAGVGEWRIWITTPAGVSSLTADVWDTAGNNTSLVMAGVSGSFQHCVLTFDDSTKLFSVYVNGALINSSTLLHSVNRSAFPFNIMNANDGFYNIGATADECGYWHRALSATEVGKLYNLGAGLPFSSF